MMHIISRQNQLRATPGNPFHVNFFNRINGAGPVTINVNGGATPTFGTYQANPVGVPSTDDFIRTIPPADPGIIGYQMWNQILNTPNAQDNLPTVLPQLIQVGGGTITVTFLRCYFNRYALSYLIVQQDVP